MSKENISQRTTAPLYSRKILILFGTRPEAIKLAPVIKELERYPERLKPVICVTAQHRHMLDQVLKLFSIKPDYDLDIMQENQTLSGITAKTLLRLSNLLVSIRPDIVLIQGDTTTAFSASLAAFYQRVRIAHIEAGLRTDQKYKPFPEEINRRLCTVLADLHFAPTERAKNNLIKENIDEKNILVTGNTAIDALFMVLKKGHKDTLFLKNIDYSKRIILVTAHRRESFGKPFKEICLALRELVKRNNDIELVYPVHLNPNVQHVVKKIISNIDRIHLIEPLAYESFVQLMYKSYFILTDSGGIQEEAPSIGKPVLVMREVTEREEAIEAGTAKLVGTKRSKIVEAAQRLLDSPGEYKSMQTKRNPFGDGNASRIIVKKILSYGK